MHHKELLDEIECKYIVFGVETATSGTPHLQGTIIMKDQITLSALKTRITIPGIHLEICMNVFKSILYCKKGAQSHAEWEQDGNKGLHYGLNADVYERGTPPMDKKTQGENEQQRWEDALNLAKRGKVEEVEPKIQIQYIRNLEYIQNKASETRVKEDVPIQNFWLWGKTGTGKSRSVRTQYRGEIYTKMANKWWDNYKEERVVLIEDLDKIAHACLGYHLKIWADRYAFRGEVKGSTRMIRPDIIVVTSNYHPQDIWQDATTLEPIERRFQIIEFTGEFNPLVPWPVLNQRTVEAETQDEPVMPEMVDLTLTDDELYPWMSPDTDSQNEDIWIDGTRESYYSQS